MFSILYHTFFIRKIQYFFFSSQNRMPKQTISLPSDKPFCSGIVETGYARALQCTGVPCPAQDAVILQYKKRLVLLYAL